MIADKLDLKKIGKKENELLKLFDLISFDPERINLEFTNHPEKLLFEEKANPDQQNFVNEFLRLFNDSHHEIDLINQFRLLLLVMESYRLKGIQERLKDKEAVSVFLDEVEACRKDPDNETIEDVFEDYREHMNYRFGNMDSWEFIRIMKEGKSQITPVIEDLKKKVEQNEDYFIGHKSS